MNNNFKHVSVLLDECITNLNIKPNGFYADLTLGGGGHSSEIVSKLTTGKLLGVDQDIEAINAAKIKLKQYVENIIFFQENFSNIDAIVKKCGIIGLDGILMDLGVSSFQLDTPDRGFSYRFDTPLDMRMSGKGISAQDIVSGYTYEQLEKIFREYGEEKFSRQIAKNIVLKRQEKEITTTGMLVDVIKDSLPAKAMRDKHPAKKVFQAIRIEVNDELGVLKTCLNKLLDILNPNGRLCVITFHSLEDRIVKNVFADWAKGCVCPKQFPVCVCGNKPKVRIINKKPILPSEEEQEINPRSKSAKLRVVEKI